jgi:phosphoesterase RecJ-like protein
MTRPPAERTRIRDRLLNGTRFLITSHARPDGDSLGSQLALAEALTQLGKRVRLVNSDPPPGRYAFLPGAPAIEVAETVEVGADTVVVLECGTLGRTEVSGLEGRFIVNIDHHTGNTGYGAVNWLDESACACGELVFELIEALGARLTPSIATNLYVAILTDTGSFRHANITARTFEICRRIAGAGVDAAAVAARVFNNGSLGRLRLTGRVLDRMQLEDDGRVAVLAVDEAMLRETGCDADDLEGVVNLPLAAGDVRAVILLKQAGTGLRVSLRSKDAIDVRRVAVSFGGGGHRNAAGLTIEAPSPDVRARLVAQVAAAVAESRPA